MKVDRKKILAHARQHAALVKALNAEMNAAWRRHEKAKTKADAARHYEQFDLCEEMLYRLARANIRNRVEPHLV